MATRISIPASELGTDETLALMLAADSVEIVPDGEYPEDPVESERWIMCKAADEHTILPEDSIDEQCLSHRGLVTAPRLAENVPGAVGQPSATFNRRGRQVWTRKLMTVRGGRVVRDGPSPNPKQR
jgi:hypothetical protein